jgi:hypothetical protein
MPYSQIKNTVESHCSRIEQVKNRISELKVKIEIKFKKTEEILVKQVKSCERNMQELNDSIKKPNMRIFIAAEDVQTKGIGNIFYKIIAENFPNLKKVLPIQVKEASRIPNKLDQNITSPWHIIIKTISIEYRERTLKGIRQNNI